MPYKTVTVDVDVFVDDVLDDIDDDDLVAELSSRGYVCIEEGSGREVFDKYDWLQLQEIVERLPRTWETDRLRDKILDARMYK